MQDLQVLYNIMRFEAVTLIEAKVSCNATMSRIKVILVGFAGKFLAISR